MRAGAYRTNNLKVRAQRFARHPIRKLTRRSLSFSRITGVDHSRIAWLTTAEKDDVLALLESRLFDAEFYGAQRGIAFRNTRQAAAHFVRSHAAGEFSPHPLISVAHVPNAVRNIWRAAGARTMLNHLKSPAGLKTDWSLLFDPRRVPKAEDQTRWSAVQAFVAKLQCDTVLPISTALGDGCITWKAARSAMIDAAASICREVEIASTRPVKSSWDEQAEQEWHRSQSRVAVRGAGLVSIIMPAWNRADRIGCAIESVRAQTYRDWELLVIDDGSTDNTAEIAESFAGIDERVRVIRTRHQGSAAARNRGVDAARGRLIAFLDSDNTWKPIFLETITAAMSATNTSAGYAASRLVHPDAERHGFRGAQTSRERLLVDNEVDLNAFVVESDCLRMVSGFDEKLRRRIDHDLVLRVAEVAEIRYFPFVGVDYDDSRSRTDRISVSESGHWRWVVLNKALVDWEALRAGVATRIVDRVSVLIPVYDDFRNTVRALRSLHETTRDHDVEIIVIDNGSKQPLSLELAAAAAVFPAVKLRRMLCNYNSAIGSNVGLAMSTGEYIVFLNNDTAVREGWLPPLRERLKDQSVRGVQPLLLFPNDSIQAAGMSFITEDSLPITNLAHHPVEDAGLLRDHGFYAVAAAALMMRASEAIDLEGFDAIFVNGWEDVDLCLRAIERFDGRFAIENRSLVTHFESQTPGRFNRVSENRHIFLNKWAGRLPGPDTAMLDRLGLEVVQLGVDGGLPATIRPLFVRSARWAERGPEPGVPRLRWGLRNPAVAGAEGDRWGDTHFVEGFAGALRRKGQEAVTYRRPGHQLPASALDDVVLGIRGLAPIAAHPGKINVLWVISHPDDVTVDELRGFELIYAASKPWAAEMTARLGRQVHVLLQATDPSLFHPDMCAGSGVSDSDVVFVGGVRRDEPRPVVVDAIEAGIHPKIWGPRWEEHVAGELVQGDYFPNDLLGQLYRSARVVLADHWPDMARQGFVANRIFDAVAAGARVHQRPG